MDPQETGPTPGQGAGPAEEHQQQTGSPGGGGPETPPRSRDPRDEFGGLHLTLASGIHKPGHLVPLASRSELAIAIEEVGAPVYVDGPDRPKDPRASKWFALARFKDGARSREAWIESYGIGLDLDLEPKADVSEPDYRDASERMRQRGAALVYPTRHGARGIWLFAGPISDADAVDQAAKSLLDIGREIVRGTGLQPDRAAKDRARAWFGPWRHEWWGDGPLVEIGDAPPYAPPRAPSESLQEAARRWNEAHPGRWPRSDGSCPMCGHRGCFGHLPDDPKRWSCFSARHGVGSGGAGVEGDGCWTGDALDVEAHRRGISPAEVLRQDGYLSEPTEARQDPILENLAAHRQERAKERSATAPPGKQRLIAQLEAEGASAERIAAAKALATTKAGDVCSGIANASLALRATLKGKLRFDERAMVSVWREKPPWTRRDRAGCPLDDDDGTEAVVGLQARLGVSFSVEAISRGLDLVAGDERFDPVREYLEALEWDGVERLDRLLPGYFGADDDPYARVVGRLVAVQAVARALDPGVKADGVLVLVGEQGARKSSGLEELCSSRWFKDDLAAVGSKDAKVGLLGAWFVELAELASLRGQAVEATKSFITTRVDRFRPPYGRRDVEIPRRSVFVATTNDDSFLRDPTGSRRWWPVRSGDVDRDAIRRDRDQLWGEAVARYRQGERWWLESSDSGYDGWLAAREEMTADDTFDDAIERFLDQDPVTATNAAIAFLVSQDMIHAGTFLRWLDPDRPIPTRADENRLADALRRKGFERRRIRDLPGYNQVNAWCLKR